MPFFAALLSSLALNFGIYLLEGFLGDPRKVDIAKENFPTADPDKFLPMIFGTVRLPINVYRNGGRRSEEIQRTRNIIFGWGPKDTIGNRYYFTLGGMLCHGSLAGFCDVIIDGKYFLSRITPQFLRDQEGIDGTAVTTVTDVNGNTVNVYTPTYTTVSGMVGAASWFFGKYPSGLIIDVAIPSLFGDPVQQGGVQGRIRLYPGDGSHAQNAAMQEKIPPGYVDYQEPSYPEFAFVVLEDLWLGNGGTVPSIEIVVSRASAKLSFGNPLIGYANSPFGASNNGWAQGDANPVGIIYEILINKKTGVGFPRAMIDFNSFQAAYTDLNPYEAGDDYGLSGVITEHASAEETIQLVLAHIDAVLYLDPFTGLLCIRLIREYGGDPTSLPLLDVSNLLSLDWNYSVQNEAVNEIQVEFTNLYRDMRQDVVKVQNLASIQRAQRVNSERMQFLWATRPEIALKIAQRELRAVSSKIGRGSFTMNRAGMMFTPGQHVRVTHPDVGTDVVCRIGTVNFGALSGGTVSGTLLQDRWTSEASSYVAPPPSESNQPVVTPWYPPWVDVNVASDTLTSIVYNLLVSDPLNAVTGVEYQIQYGADAAGPWVAGSGPPYVLEVVKTTDSFRAFYRVAYTDSNGDTQYLQGEFPQPVSTIEAIPAPSLSYVYSGSDVIVTASLSGFANAAMFASAIDSQPSDAAVLAGTMDSTSPFTYTTPAPTGTQLLYVGAAATDGTRNSLVTRLAIPPKPGTGTGAPSSAAVVLASASAEFPSGLVLSAGTNTTIDTGTAGQIKVNATGGGGGSGSTTAAVAFTFGDGGTMESAGAVRVVLIPFGFTVIDVGIRASDYLGNPTPVDATFGVKAISEAGAVSDMIGGGVAPVLSGASFLKDLNTTDWAGKTQPAYTAIVVSLDSITPAAAKIVTLTLHLTTTAEIALAFPFGDGATMETSGAVRMMPIPIGMQVVSASVRAVDGTGAPATIDAVFGFSKISEAGTVTDMVGGGTPPTVAAASFAKDLDTTDWADSTLTAYDSIVATLTSITPGTATLVTISLLMERI